MLKTTLPIRDAFPRRRRASQLSGGPDTRFRRRKEAERTPEPRGVGANAERRSHPAEPEAGSDGYTGAPYFSSVMKPGSDHWLFRLFGFV